jgi:hypothetical protein
MISIMSSSPPLQIRSLLLAFQLSFFILIVLLMVFLVSTLARDYIHLKWQSKLYEYGVTEHSDKTLHCQHLAAA